MIKYMLILKFDINKNFALMLDSELCSYDLFEYLETLDWLKDKIVRISYDDEQNNEIFNGFKKIDFNLFLKNVDIISNKNLFECFLPDSVGSFMINYIESKMLLNWNENKSKLTLGQVFLDYYKI